MSRARTLPLCAVAAAVLLPAGRAEGPRPPAPAEVRLEVVKHKPFLAELKKQRGKVVVLEVWGEF